MTYIMQNQGSKIIMINEKIKTRKKLSLLCEEFRKQQLTIGFTSGAFDFGDSCAAPSIILSLLFGSFL